MPPERRGPDEETPGEVPQVDPKVEAGAAGHGAEGRGTRNERGEATFLQAISEALWEEMERDDAVFMLGEDIGVYGGAFKATEGFLGRFGAERVIDTPIAENTIIGASVGAAVMGLRPVAELQYMDFISCGFDELVNMAGKLHYRSGEKVPMVVRGPSGGGVRASMFHSQNTEPWFAHAPGLKVIVPAFPGDAKGLLKAAIRDDNPCVFFEHKWLYRRVKEVAPSAEEDQVEEIGTARVRREGDDLTIVTYGAYVHRALEAADDLEDREISVEVLDLRTVSPIDRQAIVDSVQKTSRALVLYESLEAFGIGAEVAAIIAEDAFEALDAPVVRLAPPNTPAPFSPTLEDAHLPQVDDIIEAVERLAKW